MDSTPEASYVSSKRADIRVAYGGVNVPIEIKKNSHPSLWYSIKTQLINQYTTDPATSGYGIYLVLWFGEDETTFPPSGSRPITPDELAKAIEDTLTGDEAQKILVSVIDVTKP